MHASALWLIMLPKKYVSGRLSNTSIERKHQQVAEPAPQHALLLLRRMYMQTFQNAQSAAQNLATSINTNPGAVFETLIAQKIHGRVSAVTILGPTAAAPASKALTRTPCAPWNIAFTIITRDVCRVAIFIYYSLGRVI